MLKLSFTSATPLSDLVFKIPGSASIATKPEPGILLHNIQENNPQSRKMVLKVCLQRSTNRFLFAEAMDDFVEFLVSFLIVPLGGVEFLLGGNTGLKNIDNLYRSISNGIDKKYFTTPETKSRLINPRYLTVTDRRTSFYRSLKIVVLHYITIRSGMDQSLK